MLRTLARAAQASRVVLPTFTAHPRSLSRAALLRDLHLNPIPPRDRAALVVMFLRVPFVGPVTTNQLVNAGCHSYADALAQCAQPGSGVRLDNRQHYFVSEAQWVYEWRAKQRRMAENEDKGWDEEDE